MIRQVAALPYRTDADGQVRVMLITSRETQRWVIPKGNAIAGLSPPEAAAQEAFEEAGIRGSVDPVAVGRYRYAKRRKNGQIETIAVDVFPFAFNDQVEHWPEQHERTTAWFTLADAAAAVDEPDLRKIIGRFRAEPG